MRSLSRSSTGPTSSIYSSERLPLPRKHSPTSLPSRRPLSSASKFPLSISPASGILVCQIFDQPSSKARGPVISIIIGRWRGSRGTKAYFRSLIMGALQPGWAFLEASQSQPISFQPADNPRYKPIKYNDFSPQTDEWQPEQESQESDNEGEMLSLTGFSPADSNNGIQFDEYEVQKPDSRPSVGEVKSISNLGSHPSESGSESIAYSSRLRQRFASYRPILACESTGWHAIVFAYFEIFLHSRSQIEVDEEVARVSSLDNLLRTAGQFEIALIQHMINETLSLLKDLPKFKSQPRKQASELLLHRFNDPRVSGSIICHFRLIASSWLVAKSNTYKAHIPEGFDISTYRNCWLNAPHQEIDKLGMRLLVDVFLRPLHVGLEVISVGEGTTATELTYPTISVDQDNIALPAETINVCLLHRNTHYDILYTDPCASKGEETDEASKAILEVMPQTTEAEFDAYPFQGSYQITKARFVKDLPTFNAEAVSIIPYLTHLELSESKADSVLGVSQLGCVLDVHTAVSHETFKAKNAPLTGLGDITAFAIDQEETEAVLRAQRSRLKETEPKFSSSSSSGTEIPDSLTAGSFLPQEHDTDVNLSQPKHDMNLEKGSPEIQALDHVGFTEFSRGEPPDADRQSNADYETESEGDDDEEDSQDDEYVGGFLRYESLLMGASLKREDSMKSILGKVKNELEECLMKEFWIVANQILNLNTRTHGSSPGASSPSSDNNESLRKQSPSSTPGKRSREDDNGEHPERDGERGSKKPKAVLTLLQTSGEPPHFACPYRKHDPRRYNVNQWATCALTPQKGVSRVKSHLYRHHIIHQCLRCKCLFPSLAELDMHALAREGCDVRESPYDQVEGITERLKTQIQSRKKLYAGQTEVERWQQVYQMLFPNEIVPSPYFEPVKDLGGGESQAPDSIKLEEYLRREVPRVFRGLLDSEVDNELQSIEAHLKSRLLVLLQQAHDCALKNYRPSLEAAGGPSSSQLSAEPQNNVLEPRATAILNIASEDTHESSHPSMNVGLDADERLMYPKSHQCHSLCDSSCYPDSWGTELSQQTTIETTTDSSRLDESVRSEDVDGSMQPQKAGPRNALYDTTWSFNSDIMTMDDPLNSHMFTGWNQL